MKIRVLGAGFYGCSIAVGLLAQRHDVEVFEAAHHIFAGASGGIPARLHTGSHYPRSRQTRAACQDHLAEFMLHYGHLTAGVPVNIYAVASHDSLVDFDQFRATLKGEIEYITVHDPAELGLQNVEGAILTGERHIVTRLAREHFERLLLGRIHFGQMPADLNDRRWDWTIDCTFAALDNGNIDRYEPCLTALLEGPVDRAVTIMDGPFGSIYPWDEAAGLSSLTSARYTPITKSCRNYAAAREILDRENSYSARMRAKVMLDQMAEFWPACLERYQVADYRFSIRAMPRSAADTRLVDVAKVGERCIRVRAGKIDAVKQAERQVRELIGS
jgi:hypothetical protein